MGTDRIVIARSEDVAPGDRIVVRARGTEIAVFRVGDALHAWKNYCAHAGGPVGQGLLINRVVELLDDKKRSLGDDFSATDVHIVCPWHGYEYNVRTGEHPADPRIRLAPVPVFEEGGEILVELGRP